MKLGKLCGMHQASRRRIRPDPLRPAGPAHVAAVSDGNHHSSRPDDPLRIQTQDESRFLRLDYVNTIVEHLWAGGQMIAIAKRI